MKIKIERITPAIAARMLETNHQNRNVRDSAVNEYAHEMLSGRWGFSPDCIAFDEDGNLTNGQHRLRAVIQSGVTIDIGVIREVPKLATAGIYNIDITDAGRKRSVADQLQRMHDVTSAKLTAAAARTIAIVCCGCTGVKSFPMGSAVGVLAIYGGEIKSSIPTMRAFKPLLKSSVLGVLSFAAKIFPKQTSEFASQLAAGVGLAKGDPSLTLRSYLTTHATGGGLGENHLFGETTANAFYNFLNGSSLTLCRRGLQGLDFLRSKQKANVESVRLTCGA